MDRGANEILRRTQPLPPLAQDAHKGTAGRILCLAGSETMPGAAILVVRAAQRAGAGLVTLATFDRSIITSTSIAAPEAVYLDLSRSKDLVAGRLPTQLNGRDDDVRLAGPGLGKGGRTDELMRRLIADDFDGPLVLDADGLNVIREFPEILPEARCQLVVTPHPGEAARLLGCERLPADEAGRIDCALRIASSTSSICVLKGHGTVVTDGERVFVSSTGNPGMATAGSGDVLTGVVAAYLASCRRQECEEWGHFEAVCSAVHVHGLAGDLAAEQEGQRGMIASSLLDYLCNAQERFDESAD